MSTRQIMFLFFSSFIACIAAATLLALPLHGEPQFAQLTRSQTSTQTAAEQQATHVVVETSLNIIEDWRLRLYCVIGALGGGWLSVGMFPPPKNGIRPFALKFSCSSIAAVIFSPAILRRCGFPLDPDYVLAFSGGFGLMAWALIQISVPLFLRIFTKRASDLGNLNDDQK